MDQQSGGRDNRLIGAGPIRGCSVATCASLVFSRPLHSRERERERELGEERGLVGTWIFGCNDIAETGLVFLL